MIAFSESVVRRVRVHSVILILLLFFSTAVSGKELLDPHSLQGVYAGLKPGKVTRQALKHFQVGIRNLYGVNIQQLKSRSKISADIPVVLLGRQAALEMMRISEEELNDVAPGGHVIIADGKGIVIAGATDWDTRYGVYDFLEKLGVRFFLPRFKQAVFPLNHQKSIPWLSMHVKPDFVYRPGRSDVWRQMYYQLGDPRNGLNPELFDRKKTGSDLWIDHSAGYLVPKRLFYTEHPKYYAMRKDGTRIPEDRFTDHRTPLCLSNREVVRISTERALGWVENEPDKIFFMITYGDTGVWCNCSECRKLDPKTGSYSDRLLSWVNSIAREVGQKYPDKRLMTFAYGGTDDPPQRHIPEKNVWIVGSTGLGNVSFWNHNLLQGKISRKHIEKIDGWFEVVPDRYLVCEYQSNKYKPALIDSMVARLQYYREKGVRGIVFTYGVPQNFKVMWQYLLSHLMWDMDQDSMELAREFVDFYYGPASHAIWKIFELSHQRYVDTLKSGFALVDRYPAGFYSDEFTDQVLDNFVTAEKILKNDTRMLTEVRTEERYFIEDWMRHPVYAEMDDAAVKVVQRQLERLQKLVGNSEKERNDLARKVHKLALAVELSYPRTVEIVEEWIEEQRLFVSSFKKLKNGVRLPPQSFMFSGFGPARYGQNCPPKDAAGIYVKGNSKHRSHRMVAEFELEDDDGGKRATLELLGQASPIFLFKPSISIRLNGKEVYKGSADFVKNNWSLQSFKIPEGYLQSGKNSLEIVNTSLPASIVRWNQGWVLVADTVIRFE